MGENKIEILEPQFSDNNLINEIIIPKAIKKYFKSTTFKIKYDRPIITNESILNIPVLATILPVSWLTGTNIHVKTLDKTFLESMTEVQAAYGEMYPKGNFSAKIFVDDVIENTFKDTGYGLTFSGGLDSTYSLMINSKKNPHLITYLGTDMSLAYPEEIAIIKKRYSNLAEKMHLEISFIETNALSNLDTRRITHNFHHILGGTLWEYLMHGLFNASYSAPISTGRFNKLLMASSDPSPDFKRKYGSSSTIDGKIRWADKSVEQDGVIYRYKKAAGLKDCIEKYDLKLKVCTYKITENCSACEKCYRTIISFLIAGIDPNLCGFKVNKQTFYEMKHLLQYKKLGGYLTQLHYIPYQEEMIKNEQKPIIEGYLEFCEWYKKLDLDKIIDKGTFWRNLYYLLPFTIADALFNFAKEKNFGMVQKVLK